MNFIYRDETKQLNDVTRRNADGCFIQLPDGVTRYELGGPESGDVMVLVPGLSVPYFIYDPTFQFLTKSGLRVLRYDLFGRGFSNRPDARYNMDLYVRQRAELLDALRFALTGLRAGSRPVNLIGLSMGGPIAATFTVHYPEVVMYQRRLEYFSHNKYRLFMFLMLAGATIMSVVIWRFRTEISGSGHYNFLIWNLFLAWIPFIISYFTYAAVLNRRQVLILAPIAAFFWLIFFPNAPYILTDFQHLAGNWRDVPVWYDVMLLIWFSFTGLMLGMTSLFMMQEIIRREFGRWTGWGFVTIVTVLSSTGVYVGRFLRWNSWDIFRDFSGMARFTLARAQDPSLQSMVFMSLFGAFFLFLYVTLYTFGHLLLERQNNDLKESR